VIINVHHFADMVLDFLKANNNFGMRIEVSREEVLLDTGGGLKKAGWFFLEDPSQIDEPFLLHNVDVISTIDFHRMLEQHRKTKALATLAVQQRKTTRSLFFDEKFRFRGRAAGKGTPAAAQLPEMQTFAFTGIHTISPRLLSLVTEEGVFSIIDAYARLAGQGEKILGFRADEFYWRDLGKLNQVEQAAEDYKLKLFS